MNISPTNMINRDGASMESNANVPFTVDQSLSSWVNVQGQPSVAMAPNLTSQPVRFQTLQTPTKPLDPQQIMRLSSDDTQKIDYGKPDVNIQQYDLTYVYPTYPVNYDYNRYSNISISPANSAMKDITNNDKQNSSIDDFRAFSKNNDNIELNNGKTNFDHTQVFNTMTTTNDNNNNNNNTNDPNSNETNDKINDFNDNKTNENTSKDDGVNVYKKYLAELEDAIYKLLYVITLRERNNDPDLDDPTKKRTVQSFSNAIVKKPKLDANRSLLDFKSEVKIQVEDPDESVLFDSLYALSLLYRELIRLGPERLKSITNSKKPLQEKNESTLAKSEGESRNHITKPEIMGTMGSQLTTCDENKKRDKGKRKSDISRQQKQQQDHMMNSTTSQNLFKEAYLPEELDPTPKIPGNDNINVSLAEDELVFTDIRDTMGTSNNSNGNATSSLQTDGNPIGTQMFYVQPTQPVSQVPYGYTLVNDFISHDPGQSRQQQLGFVPDASQGLEEAAQIQLSLKAQQQTTQQAQLHQLHPQLSYYSTDMIAPHNPQDENHAPPQAYQIDTSGNSQFPNYNMGATTGQVDLMEQQYSYTGYMNDENNHMNDDNLGNINNDGNDNNNNNINSNNINDNNDNNNNLTIFINK